MAGAGATPMKIQIHPIGIKAEIVDLENVGPCYPDDDIIYFNGEPYVLHTAQPVIEATDEQINSLISMLFFAIYVFDDEELASMRPQVREWLAELHQPIASSNQPPATSN